MPKAVINVRVDGEVVETLRKIASGEGEKHLSNIIREAFKEYICSYTGEPTLRSLQK